MHAVICTLNLRLEYFSSEGDGEARGMPGFLSPQRLTFLPPRYSPGAVSALFQGPREDQVWSKLLCFVLCMEWAALRLHTSISGCEPPIGTPVP